MNLRKQFKAVENRPKRLQVCWFGLCLFLVSLWGNPCDGEEKSQFFLSPGEKWKGVPRRWAPRLSNLETEVVADCAQSEFQSGRVDGPANLWFFMLEKLLSSGNEILDDLLRTVGENPKQRIFPDPSTPIFYQLQLMKASDEDVFELNFKRFLLEEGQNFAIKLYGAQFACPWDDLPGVRCCSLPCGFFFRSAKSAQDLRIIRLNPSSAKMRYFAVQIQGPGIANPDRCYGVLICLYAIPGPGAEADSDRDVWNSWLREQQQGKLRSQNKNQKDFFGSDNDPSALTEDQPFTIDDSTPLGKGGCGQVFPARKSGDSKDDYIVKKFDSRVVDEDIMRETRNAQSLFEAHNNALNAYYWESLTRLNKVGYQQFLILNNNDCSLPESSRRQWNIAQFQGISGVVGSLGFLDSGNIFQGSHPSTETRLMVLQKRAWGNNLCDALWHNPCSLYGPPTDPARFPVNVSQAIQLALAFSCEVMAIHKADMIHSDIKVANVMVDEKGEYIYLIDLGLMVKKGDCFIAGSENGGPELQDFFQQISLCQDWKNLYTSDQELKNLDAWIKHYWDQIRATRAYPSYDIYCMGNVLPALLFGRPGWLEVGAKFLNYSKAYLRELANWTRGASGAETAYNDGELRVGYFYQMFKALNEKMRRSRLNVEPDVEPDIYTPEEIGKISALMAWMMTPEPTLRPTIEQVVTQLMDLLEARTKAASSAFLKKHRK